MTLHVNLFWSPNERFSLLIYNANRKVLNSSEIVQSLSSLLTSVLSEGQRDCPRISNVVSKLLSCPKAISPSRHSGKRKIYSQFALEKKYCSLVSRDLVARLYFYRSCRKHQFDKNIADSPSSFTQHCTSCIDRRGALFPVQLSFLCLTCFLLFLLGEAPSMSLNLLDLTPYKMDQSVFALCLLARIIVDKQCSVKRLAPI